MKTSERTALINYLEFSLVSMIEQIGPHVEDIVKDELYQQAHNIVRDIEDGLFIAQKISTPLKT